jgi:hypothetical protein
MSWLPESSGEFAIMNTGNRVWYMVVTALLLPAAGCLTFVHPIDQTTVPTCQTCQTVPDDCKEHVYIFLMHGLDPFDCCNLSGVHKYLVEMGFKNTYYGQFWSGCTSFEDKIKEIDHCDPEARIVVVGFSLGATMARILCQTLLEHTVTVHLLVYLDGKGLCDLHCKAERKKPKIINVVAPSLVWSAPHFDYAENIDIKGVWHFGSGTHPETLDALCRELNMLAASVVPLPSEPVPEASEKPKRVPPLAEVVFHASQSQRALRREMHPHDAVPAEKPATPPAQVAGEQAAEQKAGRNP